MGTGGSILKLWFEDMFASGKKFTLLGNLDDLCYNTSLQTFFNLYKLQSGKVQQWWERVEGRGWKRGRNVLPTLLLEKTYSINVRRTDVKVSFKLDKSFVCLFLLWLDKK